MEDRGGSGTGDVKGHAKVQGGGYGGGRVSSDGTTNDTSGESQRLVLKALAEDEACQHRERLANESDDLPEPPKPPDDPTQRQTKFLSIELKEERSVMN